MSASECDDQPNYPYLHFLKIREMDDLQSDSSRHTHLVAALSVATERRSGVWISVAESIERYSERQDSSLVVVFFDSLFPFMTGMCVVCVDDERDDHKILFLIYIL